MALVIFAVHFLVLKQAEVAYPAAGGTKVCGSKFLYFFAEVAHLVEHDLAKVGVAGSSPVFRSGVKQIPFVICFFFRKVSPGWWNW